MKRKNSISIFYCWKKNEQKHFQMEESRLTENVQVGNSIYGRRQPPSNITHKKHSIQISANDVSDETQ